MSEAKVTRCEGPVTILPYPFHYEAHCVVLDSGEKGIAVLVDDGSGPKAMFFPDDGTIKDEAADLAAAIAVRLMEKDGLSYV